MKVAIVILNYNGRKYLEQFLPSVIKYSDGKRVENSFFTPEIIVADNASTDDSVDFLKTTYPNITLVQLDKNYGFAEGYNQALKDVNANIYVLLNSDVEVTDNWLAPVITVLKMNRTVVACQPKIRAFHNKTHFEHAGAAGGYMDSLGYPFCRGRLFDNVEKDEGQYDNQHEIFWATGAALFIKSAQFHKIGGFDGDYFAHMEEIDLCWRLRKAGYQILAVPQSTVYHVGGGTLNTENPYKTYLNFRNNLITILKNENGWKVYYIFFLRLILDGLAGLKFLMEGKFKNIWAIIKAHFYIYSHPIIILHKRMKAQQLIDEMYISEKRTRGKINGSIVLKYYIQGKKTFKELKK
ncbi:MAG: glycosyltransferase family 2 protein [Saprospiraceae bacterium]